MTTTISACRRMLNRADDGLNIDVMTVYRMMNEVADSILMCDTASAMQAKIMWLQVLSSTQQQIPSTDLFTSTKINDNTHCCTP